MSSDLRSSYKIRVNKITPSYQGAKLTETVLANKASKKLGKKYRDDSLEVLDTEDHSKKFDKREDNKKLEELKNVLWQKKTQLEKL